MSLIKKPYEISIWRDVLIYVGKDGNEYRSITQMSGITTVDYQYYTEERLATIGSNIMNSPCRAVNPVLRTNINGTETLTFDMYYQYEEVETGKMVRNPLIDYIIDERKVKLFYEDKWHDFIIKKDDEKGRENKYSYTCTGLPANELGKTGYNVELDIELENNMGTVQDLASEILRQSDWQLAAEGQEIIDQTNDEALYKAITNTALSAKIRGTNTTFSVPSGAIIYIYYTSFATQEKDYFQFIYVVDNGAPDLLEDGYTVNCNNTRTYDLYLSNVQWDNEYPRFCYKAVNVNESTFNANKKFYYYIQNNKYVQCTDDSIYNSSIQYYIKEYGVADYRGRRYVRKQLSAYDPTLKRAVLKYTKQGQGNKEYYGYTTTDYVDATFVQNCIYNSTNFKGTSYWTLTGNSTTKTLDAVVVPKIDVDNAEQERAGYLLVNFGNSTETKLVNDGIIQNYSRINRFEKGEIYRFSVYIGTVSNDIFSPINTLPFNIKVKKYLLIDEESQDDVIYFDSTGITPVVKNNGYITIDMPCLVSATWDDLKELVGIFIIPKTANSTDYYIKDIQLYKRVEGPSYALVEITESEFNANKTLYYYYNGTDYIQCTNQSVYDSNTKYYVQHDIVEPGDVPEARIETAYHFYDPDENIGKLSEDDYVFSDADPSLYTPLFGSGEHEFEKIRSITAKESNRFNLLQELAETFECWVKFQIVHQPNGQISVETFNYYNLLNLADGASVTNYYIYDWHNKQYVHPEEQTALKGQKYYELVTRKRQVKRVIFYKEILIENYAGFKYGINLKDNNRTLDSEQIVTKIIVKNNNCDQAQNGFCSISRAKDNPIKENFAYNFDYYTSQGIIDLSTMNNDLYLELNGSIGLYPKLSRLNKERDDIINHAADVANSINNLSSEYQVAKLTYDSAFKELDRILDPNSGTIFKYTHYIYDDFYNQVQRKATENSEPGVEVPSYANEIYIINQNRVNYIYTASSDLTFYEKTSDTEAAENKTYYFISGGKFVTLTAKKFVDTTNYYEKINVTKSVISGKYRYTIPPLSYHAVDNSQTQETSDELEVIYFQTGEVNNTLTFDADQNAQVYIYNAARRRITNLGAEDFINDNFTIATLQKVVTLREELRIAKEDIDTFGPQLEAAQAEYDGYQDKLRTIANATTEIEKEFIIKYSRYIQEGSWTDDNYMDDDLYYFDALAVLYQSAYPKVTYNFSVLDLSELEGYEAYKFDIGHKTYVEDTEFFGYKIVNGLRTPAREQVVVTEATKNLDENDKNQLKIQNYKSHFEDLFQRITAATQNLEFHGGEYERAAGAVTPTGEISSATLQRSLADSAYIISNSHDQSVIWDDSGIQATNLNDPAQITRLASAGILVSADGGRTWGVAISGYGINTNYLSAGIIDADNINIMCGAWPTFRWDSLGLRAYAYETDQNGSYVNYDPSKYVVFDRFGLYGINGLTNPQFTSTQDVKDSADFGLTWDGLFIRAKHRDGYVSIDSENDITLKEYYTDQNTGEKAERIRGKFGLLYPGVQRTDKDIYGLALYDESGNATVETKSNGTLWLKSQMDIGDQTTNSIYIGVGQEATAAEKAKYGNDHGKKVFTVHGSAYTDPETGSAGGDTTLDRFTVYEDGYVVSHGNYIDGPINVTEGGKIGNMTVDGLVNTVGVRISPGSASFRLDNGSASPNSLTFEYKSGFNEQTFLWQWGSSPNSLSNVPSAYINNKKVTFSYDDVSLLFSSGVMYLKITVSSNNEDYTDTIIINYVEDGESGTSITVTSVQYGYNDSGISHDNVTWQNNIPSVPAGYWLWVKTGYSDGTYIYTSTYNGVNGQDGQPGAPGPNGNNYIKLDYYQRADRAPAALTGTYTYNFTNQTISPSIAASTGWQTFIPDGSAPCWVTSIAFYGNTNECDSTFSTPVKLVQNGANGKDANQYTIRTIAEEILKFPDQSQWENNKIYNFSIGSFQMFGFDNKNQVVINNTEYVLVPNLTAADFQGNETNYYIKNQQGEFVQCHSGDLFDSQEHYYQRSLLYDILDIEIKDYKFKEIFKPDLDDNNLIYSRYVYTQDSINYYFGISNLYNDLISNNLANKISDNYIDSTDDIIRTFLDCFEDKNGFDFRIYGQVIDLDDSTINIEKFISVKNGLNDEMLDFSVKAGGVYAAIQGKKLSFDGEGLTVLNNGFKIEVGNEGGEKTTVFSVDPLTQQLIMDGSGTFTGTIYATDGVFEGNINATTGSIGGFIVDDSSIISKTQKLQLYSQIDLDLGLLEQGDIRADTWDNVDSNTRVRTQGYISVQSGHSYTFRIDNPYEVVTIDETTFNEHKTYYYVYDSVNNNYVQCDSSSIFNNQETYYIAYQMIIRSYADETPESHVTSLDSFVVFPYSYTIHEDANYIRLLLKRTDEGNISSRDIKNLQGYEDISLINADNIHIGDNGVIDGYLKIGNLSLINPSKTNEGIVLKLQVPGENPYFKLTNNGYIEGQNWSIKKEVGNEYVVARFGKLIAEDGQFTGTIIARDGSFSGSITSSIINASTINTANFVTEKTRSMGGAFIFKPTFEILEIESTETSGQLEVTLSENSISYIPESQGQNIDIIIALSGEDIRYGKLISNTDNILILEFCSVDYQTILSQKDIYNTATILGYGSHNDVLIGINSDNLKGGDILPPRSMVMETFTGLQDNNGTGDLDYNLKLLLGDLSTLKDKDSSFNYVEGYGLYSDNVYLNGSLMTRNGQGSFAGVNTFKTVDFNYGVWGGTNTDIYANEKIVFWGGSNSLDDNAVQQSPFIVTDKGSIFANRGEFKGTVITDSTIANAVIKTPSIYGSGSGPSLKIYNTSNGGIGFYKSTDTEVGNNDDKQTLALSDLGFTHYINDSDNNKEFKFIEFGDGNNTVRFYGYSLTAYKTKNDGTVDTSSGTIYKNKSIEDGVATITINNNENIILNYNNKHNITIDNDKIFNSGGTVTNEGTTIFQGAGNNNNKQLKYTINSNNYYCLYVVR